MSRLFIFLNIIFVLIANTTSLTERNLKPKPHTFVIPVFKDTRSGLYYTNVTVGKPPIVANLVVDVRGSALWFECDTVGYNSTTSTPVPCGSLGCEQTKDKCTTCQAYLKSELTFNTHIATLINDDVMLRYMSPSSAYVAPKLPVRARIACRGYFEGMMSMLPAGTLGILGLGNSSTSFVSSLVSSYKIPFKVSLCLPSKPGNNPGSVYIGGSPDRKDVTGLLVSTPLISNRETIEHGEDYNYFIDVKSIEVNGKRLSFDHDLLKNKTGHWGRTKIKNVIPYTLLEASIYKALVRAFSEKAKKRKAVYPFTDCFSYKSFGRKSLLGKETPVISLVLGGGAKWDIHGPNSLVKVNKNVVCLAFQEADEFESLFPIEIGGYQMEDNLVEFDLETSKFSFTSSLLRHNTSCSPQ
uniref:Peptidase A1 domain-containing protein n=2 Tax=Brassica oleracea var. oleracea TaxID=109376 RepID=A0A0D3AEP0_BRAOL